MFVIDNEVHTCGIHIAIAHRMNDVVKLFFETDQRSYDFSDCYGTTPLEQAVISGNYEIIALFVAKFGPEILNKQNKQTGKWLLQQSIKSVTTTKLIDLGCKTINKRDINGLIAVHYAIKRRATPNEIITFVRCGADLHKKVQSISIMEWNQNDKTVWEHAVQCYAHHINRTSYTRESLIVLAALLFGTTPLPTLSFARSIPTMFENELTEDKVADVRFKAYFETPLLT